MALIHCDFFSDVLVLVDHHDGYPAPGPAQHPQRRSYFWWHIRALGPVRCPCLVPVYWMLLASLKSNQKQPLRYLCLNPLYCPRC